LLKEITDKLGQSLKYLTNNDEDKDLKKKGTSPNIQNQDYSDNCWTLF